ncbi:MAG TPA: hypothetical protein VLZ03_04435 [Thermodesulfobacteriota bacterium]|nr:hypothetical protein [Thermodesulfobacteriota bacterium]
MDSAQKDQKDGFLIILLAVQKAITIRKMAPKTCPAVCEELPSSTAKQTLGNNTESPGIVANKTIRIICRLLSLRTVKYEQIISPWTILSIFYAMRVGL